MPIPSVQADDELCNKMLDRYPEDQRLVYALARMDASDLKWDQVIEKLSNVLEAHPDFLPAHTLYGHCIGRVESLRRDPSMA